MPLLALLTLPFLASLVAALVPTEGAQPRGAAWRASPRWRARWAPRCTSRPSRGGGRARAALRLGARRWASTWCCGSTASRGCSACWCCGIGALVVLYARYYLSPVGPGAALLRLPARLHGRDGGRGALGQPAPARLLLGADLPLLLPAHRLLVPPPGRAARRADGAHRHRRRRPLPARGRPGAGPRGGQLRAGRGARRAARASQAHPLYPVVLVLVLLGAFTKSAQFPFHFWLPQRDGRAHARLRLPALGDDGEGRASSCSRACGRCSRAPRPGSGWWAARASSPCCSAPTWRCSRTISRGCWPTPPSRTWG